MTEGVEIGVIQRRRRVVGRLQQQCFQLGGDLERLVLLVAEGAKEVANEFTCIRANAGAHLLFKKLFNIPS